MNTKKATDTTESRQGWREDGLVDIDVVRTGTPDLADAPALLESLCDEVEQLRAIVAQFRDRHHPYPSADSPHAYCLSCLTGRKEVGSNFPEYHPWPCPDGEALQINEATDLGECSKEGCDRPSIEAKPGYVGPLYCSPVHAFTDRSNRAGGAR